jgi:hypothetical protein
MERIAMDILCELPVTSGENKHILVISDYYTKWTECFAMPNMEAKLLVEEVVFIPIVLMFIDKCGQHRKYCSIIPIDHSI